MIKKESIYSNIGEDLKKRNENWETLSSHPVRLKKVEEDTDEIDKRVDTIITTPLDGAAATQEIVDARDGEKSLSGKIKSMDDERERVGSKADRYYAQLDKELTSHKQATSNLNVNQEAKQSAEGRRVVSLPKTTGEGHGEFGLKGLTATNLIENKWITPAGAIVNIDSDYFWREGTALGITMYNSSLNKGDVFYVKATLNVFKGEEVWVRVGEASQGGSASNAIFEGNLSSGNAKIITGLKTGNGELLAITFESSDRTLAKLGVHDKSTIINLTQTFGAGNEPTKEECDKIFANYFEGTQSVNGNVRVKSVGKNLLDGEWELGALSSTDGREVDRDDRLRTSFVNANIFEKGIQYKVSERINVIYYGSDKGFVETFVFTDTFTLDENDGYLRFFGADTIDTSNIQVELGSTATPYEPYTESTQYINAPKLRSLPNGVAGSVRKDGRGGYEVVQRVGVTVLSDLRFHTPFSSRMRYFRPDDMIRGQKYDLAVSGGVRVNTGTSSSYIDFATEKSTVEDFRIEVGNPTVYYQLAEPIITPLYPSGNLITQPSGTVYIEDVVADVATYSDNALIGRSELLIKELDQLSVMDFETGGERKLDVSKAVVSTDKLSFTHPDLSNGDIVFFEYYYTEESTDGLASVEYFDSRYTIKDSVTDKHYKWSISIADGVPKIDLEEV